MADVTEPTQGASDGQDPSADQKQANLVNAAVSSHLKRILPKVLEDSLAPLREQLAAFQAPKGPETKAAPSGGDSEAFKAIEDLKLQLKKERDTAAKERRLAREEKAFVELRSELTGSGKVRPEAVDTLAKLLFHADKKVRVSDDGQVAFHHADMEYGLREGVAEYLRSKDAAMFVTAPAPGAQSKKAPAMAPRRPGEVPAGLKETPMERTKRMLAQLNTKS